MKKKVNYLVLKRIFEGTQTEESTQEFITWFKGHELWREFIVAGLRPGEDKKDVYEFLSRYSEQELMTWVSVDLDGLKFSFVHPDTDPRKRRIVKTKYYDMEELKDINEKGAIELLQGKDYELMKLSYRIKKLEKTARELRKLKKQYEGE